MEEKQKGLAGYKKMIILLVCFVFSVYGFIIKIPKPLRGNDKLLHAAFYFLAAIFLNFLFRKRHIIIFIGLALFGILIEYLQQLSNKFSRSRMHGRFDWEDVYANMKGLVLYSLIALVFFICKKGYQYFRTDKEVSV